MADKRARASEEESPQKRAKSGSNPELTALINKASREDLIQLVNTLTALPGAEELALTTFDHLKQVTF